MPINVEYVNRTQASTRYSDESFAAQELVGLLKSEFESYPKASGNVYIFSSMQVFGQKRRDIDLMIIGSLSNLVLSGDFTVKNKVQSSPIHNVEQIAVNSFIATIEVKTNPNIKYQGSEYTVFYDKTGTKESVSAQASEAKFSLVNHLQANLGIKQIIADIIWLRATSPEKLASLRSNIIDNALPNVFSFKDMIQALLLQVNTKYYSGTHHLDFFLNAEHNYEAIKRLLLEEREAKGLTKQKFELLSQADVDTDLLLKRAGQGLTVLKGRAGTGKTVHLLRTAYKLADPSIGKRCLILTYNRALLSDIQRLIDFTLIPTKKDGRTVSIKTIDSFFQSLMREYGAIAGPMNPTSLQYKKEYENGLLTLKTIIQDMCQKNDSSVLKDVKEAYVDYDYVLIDEAQDFSDLEKEILFSIYGMNRIIIADGVDQFMRTDQKQNWEAGLDNISSVVMNLERRQKTNLVHFAIAFAREAKLEWSVTPNSMIPGGRVQIYPKYTSDIHIDLTKSCVENDCENYDILILVPPTAVDYNEEGAHFKNAGAYKRHNISIYDGTNPNNRTTYPVLDQCRLYQYHSCRGLEGWNVVCYEFDEMYRILMEDASVVNDTVGLDIKKAKQREVFQWLLMPLTRPIDRLVITLKNPNSEIGQILKSMSDRFDFVEWYC